LFVCLFCGHYDDDYLLIYWVRIGCGDVMDKK